MMRSDMPEQLHQGVGSLSEVARRMFQGGAVSGGHPLDQYGQYLTQTYAAPIQRLASDAVNQFVDSVRQKEQAYFGGGGMGGGMGSPLQGGLMGSPLQGGLMGSPMPPPGQRLAGQEYAAGLPVATVPPGMFIGRQRVADADMQVRDPSISIPQRQPMPGGFEAMAGGTFDAQVAAAKNTPPAPSNLSFGVMEGFAPPVNDGFAEREMAQGPLSTASYMQDAALFDQSLRGPSPFGNNIVNQQMLGQARLEERPTANITEQNPFGVSPSTDNSLGRLSGLQAGSVLSSLFSTGRRPSLNPLVERQGLV